MKKILITGGLLVLIVFTCAIISGIGIRGISSASANAQPDDCSSVPASPQAAVRLAQKTKAAGERAANNGLATLTVTQKEVTSFLNLWSLLSGQFDELQSLGDLDQLQGLEGVGDTADIQALLEVAQQKEGLSGFNLSDLSLSDLRPRLTIKEPKVRFKDNGQFVVRGCVAVLFWKLPARIVVAPRASKGEMVLDFVEGNLGRIQMPEIVFDVVGKGLSSAILAGQNYAEITQIRVQAGKLTIGGRYEK